MVQMIPLMMFFNIFNIFQTLNSGFTLTRRITIIKCFYKITLNSRNKRIKSEKWSEYAVGGGHYGNIYLRIFIYSHIYFLSSLRLFVLLKCHFENVSPSI